MHVNIGELCSGSYSGSYKSRQVVLWLLSFAPLFAERIDIKDLQIELSFREIHKPAYIQFCGLGALALYLFFLTDWDLLRCIRSKDSVIRSATSEQSLNRQREPCPVWTVSSRCYLASLHCNPLNYMVIYIINQFRKVDFWFTKPNLPNLLYINPLTAASSSSYPSVINCSVFFPCGSQF